MSPRRRPHAFAIVTGVLVTVVAVSVVAAVSAFSGTSGGDRPRPAASSAIADPPANTVLTSDFEDGTGQEWQAAAGSRAKATTALARGGRQSLQVARRGDGQQGVSRGLQGQLSPGTGYRLSAWVRLADGAPPATVRLAVSWGWASATQSTVVATAEATGAGWVRLQGDYSPVTAVDILTARIEPVSGTANLYLDDFAVAQLAQPPSRALPALKDVFADSFDIGAAISPQQLVGAQADLLRGQFNSVTPTSAMKWTSTQPTPGVFKFDTSDKIVKFATDHGMKVRGHTLVWHNQTPDWVFLDADGLPMTPTPENKALLLSRMENHIETLVGQYRGRISSWDVVNEVISDDGTMRQSKWFQIAGRDFISSAFAVAHAADPAAKLCVNDFNLTQPARRDAMYQLVADLKAQGVPIDCIGSQTHINIQAPTAAAVTASIEKFAKLGVDQQITELDMSVYTDKTSSYPAIPADLLAQQAAQYRAQFAVYLRHRDLISSVTFWGLADNETWLSSYPIPRTDAPLLFDTDLRPKPAFWAVVGSRS